MSIFKDSETLFKKEFKFNGLDMTFKAVIELESPYDHFEIEQDAINIEHGHINWFCAVVECQGEYTTLGCCAYSNFNDFIEDNDYFEDMKHEVYELVEKNWILGEIGKLRRASNLVESVMRANSEYPHSKISEFNYEDCNNIYKEFCFECGNELEDKICPECEQEVEYDTEYKEVLEWWIIDEWQYIKLNDLNEVTLNACGLFFWGRTCTGQVIELDGVFQKIFKDLNQKN